MDTSYNSYVGMEYPGNNLLTRIIDAIKGNALTEFTPNDICKLLNEGGITPAQTIKACISCKTTGYRLLAGNRPYFVRIRRGIYRLADPMESD